MQDFIFLKEEERALTPPVNEEYIAIEKQFIGKKPNTRYLATKLGKKAFQEHIEALEKLIQKNN